MSEFKRGAEVLAEVLRQKVVDHKLAYNLDLFPDDLKSTNAIAAQMGRYMCDVFLKYIDETLENIKSWPNPFDIKEINKCPTSSGYKPSTNSRFKTRDLDDEYWVSNEKYQAEQKRFYEGNVKTNPRGFDQNLNPQCVPTHLMAGAPTLKE